MKKFEIKITLALVLILAGISLFLLLRCTPEEVEVEKRVKVEEKVFVPGFFDKDEIQEEINGLLGSEDEDWEYKESDKFLDLSDDKSGRANWEVILE